jgi:mannose-6-phosphate isomerase-like protein (cupin superfamily)
MSMVETLVKPGSGPTYHSHAREDETFYVVSGTADVWIDREIFRCEAGDRVFGPRNVFHTYRNVGNTDLKMILAWISQTRACGGGEPGSYLAIRWCRASGWAAI